jgi:hypothetical protein
MRRRTVKFHDEVATEARRQDHGSWTPLLASRDPTKSVKKSGIQAQSGTRAVEERKKPKNNLAPGRGSGKRILPAQVGKPAKIAVGRAPQ